MQYTVSSTISLVFSQGLSVTSPSQALSLSCVFYVAVQNPFWCTKQHLLESTHACRVSAMHSSANATSNGCQCGLIFVFQ